jgi:hypothetical protein
MFFLLLGSLPAFAATTERTADRPAAANKQQDVQKTVPLIPPDMNRDLQAPQEKRSSGTNVKKIQESPHCSELRSQLESAKKATPEPGGLNGNKTHRPGDTIADSRRTKLESAYRQQCQ